MSATYGIGGAKTKLVRGAEEDEEAMLRRGSPPMVRVMALAGAGHAAKRAPGRMRGRVSVPQDIDEWPADIAQALGVS
jgi:hypothetical protein